MMQKKIKTSYGFTLIETLVAITMLSIVIAAVTSIVQMSLVYGTYSKDEISAKYLAEEGVEYIRNLRDLNVVNYGQAAWMNGIAQDSSAPCGNITVSGVTNSCYIDSIAGSVPQLCNTQDPQNSQNRICPILNYNDLNGQYTYTSGAAQPSKFTRTIKISRVDGGNSPYSVLVQVTVSWNENNGPQSYVVSEYLFDWYTGS